MKTFALLAALLVAAPAFAEDGAADEYAKALDKENTDRDVNGAMEMYKSIVKKHKDEEEIAGKAQYRIGECWEKLGVAAEAKQAYETLIRDFPGQTALVDKAKERLGALAGAPVQESAEDRVKKKLEKTRIDLDFTDTALSDVLDFVRDFTHINCFIDPADEIASKKITFAVKDLPLNKVLDLLAETSHLSYLNWKGTLVWASADRIAEFKKLAPVEADANAPEDDRKIDRSIKALRISLNFVDTPLEETMSFIREVTQLNILLDEDCLHVKVNLKVDDMPLGDVLSLLEFTNWLRFTIKNGAIVVKERK